MLFILFYYIYCNYLTWIYLILFYPKYFNLLYPF